MSISSTLKNASIGTTAAVIFYLAMGVVFLVLLPFLNFPPHIALTGIMSIAAAYALLSRRAWAPWLVVALFLISLTMLAFTLFFSMFVNWPVNVGLIVYLIFSFYFMYYTLSRGTP
ncbi:TPA: hypothetical protein HA273_03550 [Candidatus Bathyarchaeota archaeon]|nr:hypothetical protein [Candidatus Bathyarchaeota archaeon]HIJ08128.1 hypothetical protein [Candidatus Bathyarchaeota archaeon]